MTKFIDKTKKEKTGSPTIFKHFLTKSGLSEAYSAPDHYEFVEYLFTDSSGLDIFKAYDEDQQPMLYIGKKGDEFN